MHCAIRVGLPTVQSDADQRVFQDILRKSIRPVFQLQRDVEEFSSAVSQNEDLPLRMCLSEREKAVWDEMLKKRVKTQYWSDGFVRFACLADRDIKCHLNGILEIFCGAGYHCLAGLARRLPVRGAIDIAWGVELQLGGLYGPVVANAYELESEVAQYPRIVVGLRAVEFLEIQHANTNDDLISRINRDLATRCLNMLVRDLDGQWCLHYLGDDFASIVTEQNHSLLCHKARRFVNEKIEEYGKSVNDKLESRYRQLLKYFDSVPLQRLS